MAAKSGTLQNQVIQHYFGGSASPQPTQWWINVYATNPTDLITATSPTPLSAPVQITQWTISGNTVSNTNIIQFPAVSVGQTWSASYFAILDGNGGTARPLYYGQFRVVKNLQEGDILLIAAGQLVIQEL